MQKSYLYLFLFFVFTGCISCQNYKYRDMELYPIRENGLFGFVDTLGNKIVVPQYLCVSYFSNHLAAAVVDTFYEYRSDSTLHKYGLDYAKEVNKRLYLNIRYGYINIENEFVIAPNLIRSFTVYEDNYKNVKTSDLQNCTNEVMFSEGLAPIQDSITLNYGFIDTLGIQRIPPIYYSYKNFSSGKAAVLLFKCNEGEPPSNFCFKWAYIDKDGKPQSDFIYASLTSLVDGRSIGTIWSKAKVPDYLNDSTDIDTTESEKSNDIESANSLQYRISVLLDENGKIINNSLPQAYHYYDFNDGVARAELEHAEYFGKDFKFLDKNGNFLKPKKSNSNNPYLMGPSPDNIHFKDLTYMSEGYAGVKGPNGKWLFIDKDLNFYAPVNDIAYDDLYPFCNGLAAVCQNGKWGYVDKDFNIVIPFKYDWAGYAGKHLIQVRQEDKNSHIVIESLINRRDSVVWQYVENKSK